MSYNYDSKKKAVEMPNVPKEYPNEVQSNLQAIQHVDVHAGHKLNLESELKSRIEQQTGENFIYTVKKILQWSNRAEDIATALGLTTEEFKACSKVLTANEILKIKKD